MSCLHRIQTYPIGPLADSIIVSPNETNYSDLEQAGQKLAESKEMLFYTNFGSMLSSGLVIASTIFFIRMVKQISLWQEIKSGRSI